MIKKYFEKTFEKKKDFLGVNVELSLKNLKKN
jgi:hypothetical protein